MSIIINEIYSSENDIQENELHEESQIESGTKHEDESFVAENVNSNSDVEEVATEEIVPVVNNDRPIITRLLKSNRAVNTEYRTVDNLILVSARGQTIYIPIKVPGTPDPPITATLKLTSYNFGNASGNSAKFKFTCKANYSDIGSKYRQYEYPYIVRFSGYQITYENEGSEGYMGFDNLVLLHNESVTKTDYIHGIKNFIPTNYEFGPNITNPPYVTNISPITPFLTILFHDIGYNGTYHEIARVSGGCEFHMSDNFNSIINKYATGGNTVIPSNALTVKITFSVNGSQKTSEIKNIKSFNYEDNGKDFVFCNTCPDGSTKMFEYCTLNTGGSTPPLEVVSVTATLKGTYLLGEVKIFTDFVNHL